MINTHTKTLAIWIMVLGVGLLGVATQVLAARENRVLALGLVLIIPWVLSWALIAWRTAPGMQPPTGWRCMCLLGMGAAASLGSLIPGCMLLGGVSYFFLGLSFLISQRDRNSEERLSALWPVLAVVVVLPGLVREQVSVLLRSLSFEFSGNLLDSLAVQYESSGFRISTPSDSLLLDTLWNSWASWPAAVSMALLFCGWMRRSSLVAVSITMLLALSTCLMLQTAAIVSRFSLGQWAVVDFSVEANWIICQAVCWAVGILMFLSADRLIQFFFYPIGSKYLASQANPWVTLWNRTFARRRPSRSPAPASRWQALSLVLILVCMAVAGSLQAASLPGWVQMASPAPSPARGPAMEAAISAIQLGLAVEPSVQRFAADGEIGIRCGREAFWFPRPLTPACLTVFDTWVNTESAINIFRDSGWQLDAELTAERLAERDDLDPRVNTLYFSSPINRGTLVCCCFMLEESAGKWSVVRQPSENRFLPDQRPALDNQDSSKRTVLFACKSVVDGEADLVEFSTTLTSAAIQAIETAVPLQD